MSPLQYFDSAPSVAGTGKLLGIGNVFVNGHSLGGELATAFARIFGGSLDISHITTFNSPGFTPLSSLAFQSMQSLLGSGMADYPAPAQQTNLFAENGTNFATNTWFFSQKGVRTAVFNEEGIGIPNHYMYKLTDALALAAAMETLDPSMALQRVSQIFDAGSNVPAGSIEGVLDGLRHLLLDGGLGAVPIGDAGDSGGTRVAYHQILQQLQDSAAFKSMAGKVRIEPSGRHLGEAARSDFGALAALLTLSPVHVVGNGTDDSALTALWSSATWSGHYTAWLADKTMTQAERDAGKAVFSEQWLADRAAMLDTLVRANQDDEAFYNDRTLKDVWLYNDEGSHTRIARQPGGPGTFVQHRIEFGAQRADALLGDNAGDRLYGGAGTDSLTGQGGDDHLEGNAGADTLDGGADNDMLVGGAGADTLNGGAGHDTLLGGADADTYRFSAGWGADTIEDSDGLGLIEVDGLGPLTGKDAKKVAENVWQTEDKRVNYTLVSADAARNDLYISFSDTDTIRIRNWSTGRLGITLADTPAPAPTGSVYAGDFVKRLEPDDPTKYVFSGLNYAKDVASPGADDVITGSAAADQLQGLGGNDALAGLGGDDRVEGGDGHDLLLGGLGRDDIRGGTGNDFIYGSGAGGLIYPRFTTDAPPVAGGPEYTRGFSWITYDAGIGGGDVHVYTVDGAPIGVLDADASNDHLSRDADADEALTSHSCLSLLGRIHTVEALRHSTPTSD